MFGHHVWCNYASPRNDPATCKQCKRLNTEYPEKPDMMNKYFPDVIVKSRISPMDQLIDKIHQLIIDNPKKLNAHQIAKKTGNSVPLVLHCTTILRGSNKVVIDEYMKYRDITNAKKKKSRTIQTRQASHLQIKRRN